MYSLAHTERPSLYKNLILLTFHSGDQRYLCSSYKLHACFQGRFLFLRSFISLRFPATRLAVDRRRELFARINRKSCSLMGDEKKYSSFFRFLSFISSHFEGFEMLSCLCFGSAALLVCACRNCCFVNYIVAYDSNRGIIIMLSGNAICLGTWFFFLDHALHFHAFVQQENFLQKKIFFCNF